MIEAELQKDFNQEYIKTAEIKPTKSKSPKILIILAVAILAIGLLIFIATNKPNNKIANITPTITPEQRPIPTPSEIKINSPLASDAGVVQVKKEIEENVNSANTIDLSENNLSFPIIDFSIGF